MMGKQFAPNVVRKARENARWSKFRTDPSYYEDILDDYVQTQNYAAAEQNHEAVAYWDSVIKEERAGIERRRVEEIAAQKELRRVLKSFTSKKPRSATESEVVEDPITDETEPKVRRSKCGRFGSDYRPTRLRFWRPTENNWKLHRKNRWRECE